MSRIRFTPIIMSVSNSQKTQNGYKARKTLASMLNHHVEIGTIRNLTANFRVGMPGFPNTKQFYAPFKIQFADGKCWLVYTTTTLRDRVKAALWDAYNIKAIEASVEKAFLVYPSGEDAPKKSEAELFKAKHAQYVSKEDFSSLDGIVDSDELERYIEEKADAYYRELYGEQLSQEELGRRYDFFGKAFEREIAEMMSDERNLAKFNGKSPTGGYKYDHFVEVLGKFGISPGQAIRIRATANHKDIGNLPSGGPPKTDVIVGIKMKGKKEQYYTISCKRVKNRDSVSAHQYSADAFADVLDKDNMALREALNVFQAAKSFKTMSQETTDLLEKEIAPYVEALCRWVVGGYGGAGDDKQKAQYVVAYRLSDNAFAVHSTDKYVKLLMDYKCNKILKTPFSWTVASKSEGKDIQLKMPIIF